MQSETHQIPASKMWISRGLNPPRRTSLPTCPGCGAAPQARLRASSTRYGGAPLIRDPGPFQKTETVCPGSAAHHSALSRYVLRRARETRAARFTRLRFPDAVQREAVRR